MWRWAVFFLFLLKKQQHLEHKEHWKSVQEACSFPGLLPASAYCGGGGGWIFPQHPPTGPPSIYGAHPGSSEQCLPGKEVVASFQSSATKPHHQKAAGQVGPEQASLEGGGRSLCPSLPRSPRRSSLSRTQAGGPQGCLD